MIEAIRRLVEIGLKAIDMIGSGLSPVKQVTITIDGVIYEGTYFVQNHMVHVVSSFGAKATQLGGSTSETLAKLLLSELVREIGAAAAPEIAIAVPMLSPSVIPPTSTIVCSWD